MKAPICEICVKHDDILCAGCQKKLEEGIITASDIKISRKLYQLENLVPSIKDVELVRAFDAGKVCLLIVGKGSAAKLIGRRGQIVRKIAQKLGKDVRVVELTNDVESMVEAMLKPASFMGINVLYTKEGEIYRIRVPSSHRQFIHDPEALSEALSLAINKQVEIIFE